MSAENVSKMLTDMTPSAGPFYGSQIPAMGMNIGSHIQKPVSAVSNNIFIYTYRKNI